jgi:hypothetical protein
MRRTDADADTQAAAETIRAELRRARTSLARIEEAVARLSTPPGRSAVERERPDRYYQVLVGVYELGGRHGIAADELGAVGGRHGYDRRGLGGFFAGARAPLRTVDGRVRLTPEGLRLVDVYLAERVE